MSQCSRFQGKVAIITGGAGGIGEALVRNFASEGSSVVIPEMNFEKAQSIAKDIVNNGGKALALRTDISNEASTQEMAIKVIEKFGKIDILVNNAAMLAGIVEKPFYNLTVREWDQIMNVNLRGTFLCCKACVPQMKKQGKGKIINISSDAVHAGFPYFAHYIASKGGVISFSRAIARELGEFNINVNIVAPGLTRTDAAMALHDKNENIWEVYETETSLKRAGQPSDQVGAVMFLASEESDYITGQTLIVNGGYIFI